MYSPKSRRHFLADVGRGMLVATVGVITPMVLGIGAMELIGNDFKTSLFVGAALTRSRERVGAAYSAGA